MVLTESPLPDPSRLPIRRPGIGIWTGLGLGGDGPPLFDFFLQALGLEVGDQGLEQEIEVALENLRQPMDGERDPVVGDPPLGEVVGANLLRAIPRTDLRAAIGGALGVAGIPLPAVETGIASSAVVLGLMVALAARPPLWVAAAIVAAISIYLLR